MIWCRRRRGGFHTPLAAVPRMEFVLGGFLTNKFQGLSDTALQGYLMHGLTDKCLDGGLKICDHVIVKGWRKTPTRTLSWGAPRLPVDSHVIAPWRLWVVENFAWLSEGIFCCVILRLFGLPSTKHPTPHYEPVSPFSTNRLPCSNGALRKA